MVEHFCTPPKLFLQTEASINSFKSQKSWILDRVISFEFLFIFLFIDFLFLFFCLFFHFFWKDYFKTSELRPNGRIEHKDEC